MRLIFTAVLFLGLWQGPLRAQDEGNGPVVVELFTSQGCSSCPPADAILHELAQRDDIIALALHVDYWDYIGWVDIFGRPENTARQQAYARAAEATMIYTPQMVIGGVDMMIGSRPMRVMEAIADHSRRAMLFDVKLSRNGDTLRIFASEGVPGSYDVQLVRYKPHQTVAIRRGENAGQELDYANIVTAWDVLGQWDGAAPLAISADVQGPEPVVVIIQAAGHGAIAGAARLR
jgi:hypothetical protein